MFFHLGKKMNCAIFSFNVLGNQNDVCVVSFISLLPCLEQFAAMEKSMYAVKAG